MFIPLTSDASLKYWPVATVSLIAVHIVVLVIQMLIPEQQIQVGIGDVDGNGEPIVVAATVPGWQGLMLSHGEGLHPTQWLTSMMIHGGWGHLIGNMIFLWVFGHVVEGIVGPYAFAGLYLGMGILQNMLEQLIFLAFSAIPSLGASSAIYSIMMLAAIWAPQDNIQSLFLVMYRPFIINIPILIMGLFYFLWDLGFAMLQGFSLGAELLHVSGAVIGLATGVCLLANGRVDCDGRDLFSMIAEARGRPLKKPKAATQTSKAPRELTPEELAQQKQKLAFAWKSFDACLDAGNPDSALMQLHNVRKLDREVHWEEPRLLRLIQLLQQQKRLDDVVRYSERYLASFRSRAEIVRLNLARIIGLEKGLPRKALKVLDAIELPKLDANNRKVAENLRAHCNKLIADGAIEISED